MFIQFPRLRDAGLRRCASQNPPLYQKLLLFAQGGFSFGGHLTAFDLIPQRVVFKGGGKQVVAGLASGVNRFHAGQIKSTFAFIPAMTLATLCGQQRFDVRFK